MCVQLHLLCLTDNQISSEASSASAPSCGTTQPSAASSMVHTRDGVAALEVAVRKRMHGMTRLDLENQGISNSLAGALADMLPLFQQPLQHISISGALSSELVLCEWMVGNVLWVHDTTFCCAPGNENLYAGSRIDDAGAQGLLNALSTCSWAPQSLDLSCNSFGALTATSLTSCLKCVSYPWPPF